MPLVLSAAAGDGCAACHLLQRAHATSSAEGCLCFWIHLHGLKLSSMGSQQRFGPPFVTLLMEAFMLLQMHDCKAPKILWPITLKTLVAALKPRMSKFDRHPQQGHMKCRSFLARHKREKVDGSDL